VQAAPSPLATSQSRLPDTASPNEIWSADFKGEFCAGDAQACYPLMIEYGYSRFLFACTADTSGLVKMQDTAGVNEDERRWLPAQRLGAELPRA
jgi:hypothetical protein